MSKEKLILDIFKYDFEYVNGKVDFGNVEIWLWVCLLKKKLTLEMSKYDFEYVS
jgi:hypothetical protein